MEQKNTVSELLTIKEASTWASLHLAKNVTPSNISYLIQYGKIKKYGQNGSAAGLRFKPYSLFAIL
ncbi:MAG: hypothetical protein CR988_03315 [Treponema sp.]|nr:MAG: hypothetical protein CR988_03315 [Treponema sp.]